MIKGQTAFTTEDPADERFITYLVFEIGLRKPVLLHKNPQQRYTVFACFEARIKFFKFHRVIFPGIDAGSQCYQRCKTDPPQRLKIDPGVNLLL